MNIEYKKLKIIILGIIAVSTFWTIIIPLIVVFILFVDDENKNEREL